MAIKFLKQDQLPAFLEALAKNARVVAPFKRDGVVQFEPWQSGKEVELDVLLAKQSPKEWIFPQTETYLKFDYSTVMPEEGAAGADGAPALPHEAIEVETLNEAPAQVIFGLRPCDVRGFVQMDQVFGGYGGFYFDPLYNARREATTLLAVTCRDPRSTCFCTRPSVYITRASVSTASTYTRPTPDVSPPAARTRSAIQPKTPNTWRPKRIRIAPPILTKAGRNVLSA